MPAVFTFLTLWALTTLGVPGPLTLACAWDDQASAWNEAADSDSIPLVLEGRSAYRIVIPSLADAVEKKAAKLLRKTLQEISGVALPVVTDSDEPRPFEVLVGRTNRLDELRLSGSLTGLEDDGFLIRTCGKKLVLVGGIDRGTLYAVTTLLETYLGYRKYTAHISHIPKADNIVLDPIHDRQAPVIKHRALHYYDAFDADYADWHKLDHRGAWKKNCGLWVHTFKTLVPPEDFFFEHPDYFALNRGVRVKNTQLCLSRPEVFEIARGNLAKLMRDRPDAQYWSVSQNDIYGPCECRDCAVFDDREGSHAGSLLRFVNRIAARFEDKTITTLAYQYSRAAPKRIVPAKNVQIVLCSIECNRSRPIAEDPAGASFVRDLENWSRICDDLYVWDYVVQFSNYVSPFPNLRVLQPNIQLFVRHQARSMFQQGNPSKGGEFSGLKSYLIAKLLWDPDLDVEAVIDDYLQGVYGAAAPYLRQYIDLMHDAVEDTEGSLDIYGHPFQHVDGFLSPTFVAAYTRLFDRAEAAVADSPELLDRVRTARLPLEYTILEQGKRFGTNRGGFFETLEDGGYRVRPEARQRLDRFVDRCRAAGITHLNEKGFTPEQYRKGVERIFEGLHDKSLAFKKPVTLSIPFSPKYPAGGAAALTNGLKGGTDHSVNWLGFEGTDMEAVVDLESVVPVSRVRLDFMQAVQFWIFLPKKVELSVSRDGQRFDTIATLNNPVSTRATGIVIEPFETAFEPVEARFVRVRAQGMKTCPDWHIGAGGKAWIFTDEIVIE